jgi:3-oxoadipate enol-lactonase
MAFAEINGQQIHYQDTGGDGPPVVLAHGFLMDLEMFAPQVAALRDQYRVITWDERGFGRTQYDGKPFTYWDSAADCIGLLDHLGIQRAVIGGMSQGGFISLRVALTAPERVRALILLDTEAGAVTPEKHAAEQGMIDIWLTAGPIDQLADAVADLIIAQPSNHDEWIAKWRSRPNEAMREPAACLQGRDDLVERLGHITCPALVVHGVDDVSIEMDKAQTLAAGLSGSGDVVQVPGAHAANLTHPDAVNGAIIGFLSTLPA